MLKSPIQPTPADTTPLLKPRLETRPGPAYRVPFFRPPPRPPDETIIKDCQKDLQNFDPDRKAEFEENSPYQEGIIFETYKRPDALLIQEPLELQDLIDTSKLILKFIPKQVDIDKILDIVKVQMYDDYGIGWLLNVCSPMPVPRQLRFSLYSGAVITEGWM